MPRAWLFVAAGLFIAPWIAVGAIYLRPSESETSSVSPSSVEAAGPSQPADPGPWGELAITPVVVSPPVEYVSTDLGDPGPAEWWFPASTMAEVESFLAASGLAAEDARRLRAAARAEPRIRGVLIRPDPEVVRGLSPDVRGRIYSQLARSAYNGDQAQSYRFLGSSIDAWLSGSPISAATRRLVEPLVYRDGRFLHFADLDLLRSAIADDAEMRRLRKTLYRQSTVLVRLSIDDEAEVRPLAEYWGRGGRRTDLQPLLESIAGAGADRSIDIVHLLPEFARDHMYRYPRITAADLDRPIIANCLWTALNFFSDEPDDRYLDVTTALNTLKNDYYLVEDQFQLGDIAAFLDEEGDIFHVVVYLADDLVFSKNGTTPMSPWTIMSVDDVKGYYRSRSAHPRLIYHRRTGF